jgi:hypothetical protein
MRQQQQEQQGGGASLLPWERTLAQLLLEQGHASALPEAQTIVDSIAQDPAQEEKSRRTTTMTIGTDYWSQSLQDYMGLTPHESVAIVEECHALVNGTKRDQEDERNEHNDDDDDKALSAAPANDDNNDDDDHLGPGECELCERYIRLTRHHLIPKSTWPRVETQLAAACQALAAGDTHQAGLLASPALVEHLQLSALLRQQQTTSSLGAGLLIKHAVRDRQASKTARQQQQHQLVLRIRTLLSRTTCEICRPCHSAVHRLHDNVTLAAEYCSVERLVQDPAVSKFCQWASKQRAGRYAVQQK